MTLGERIKQVRTASNLRQKEFAECLTVSPSYISKVEADKEIPTDMLIKLIALEFNTSYIWLKCEQGEVDISQYGADYFARKRSADIRNDNMEYLNDFIDEVKSNASSALDNSFHVIISSFITLFAHYKTDDKMCSLIFDVMSGLIAQFADTMLNIEDLDKSHPAYLNKVFSCLRVATDDIDNKLQDVGKLYEEKAK